ncbi:hypothetical protein LUZ60_004765 [Juncus effusus]|nr:hypothetical protein LUZ60_004765 [Juncus effusus]
MELHNANNNESNEGILGSELWEWQNEDICLTKDPTNNISSLLWDELDFLGDQSQTPIKDCMDFGYNNNNNIDNNYYDNNSFHSDYANKEIQIREEISPEPSSLIKRRKMLQFNSDSNAVTSSTVTSMSSTSSNGISENLRHSTSSISNYPDANNVLRKSNSSEWWNNGNYAPEKLAYYSSDETSCSKNSIGSPLDQVNISGFGERVVEVESEVVQETAKLSTLKIFKGKKSLIKTPKKITSQVANPFTLIKPFGPQDGVTLEDINAKIHKPPPTKKKIQQIGNFKYQISEFSGKPVVGKKKICTEGGKGSITILRTKG